MTDELRYTDSETGEWHSIDVSEWQFVIATDLGELCRVPLVLLALQINRLGAEKFRYSLLSHADSPVGAIGMGEGWVNVLVEKQ